MDFLRDINKVEFKRNKELNKYKRDLLKGKYFKIKTYLSISIIVIIFLYGVTSIIIDLTKLF